MGPPTPSRGEVASSGRRSTRTYRLILLGETRRTAEVETDRELGLRDRVEVQGATYEVVALAWKRGREHLLCSLRAYSHAADEPVGKEKTWWSTEWR
jgi:hypothetical protein